MPVAYQSNLPFQEQKVRLSELGRQNKTIFRCYLLKDRLRYILNHLTGKTGKVRLALCIRAVLPLKTGPLVHFAHMLLKRYRGAISYFQYPVINSQAESINNVIGTVIKNGYRDLEHLKLKIMHQQMSY